MILEPINASSILISLSLVQVTIEVANRAILGLWEECAMATVNITIPPGAILTLQQVVDAAPAEAVPFIFEEIGSRLAEPGEHTIELPPELEGQGEVLAVVIPRLLVG